MSLKFMTMNLPWIRKADKLFPKKKKINDGEKHKRYNTAKWRRASGDYFRGKPCDIPYCGLLATCTDHIIPIEQGGSQWDRRNWQRLCTPHHAIKRAKERHGYCEEKVGTKYGYIPKRREMDKPDIVGQSYIIK